MDNRRLFLAALLSLAVLFLWQWMFPPASPVAPPSAPESAFSELEGDEAAPPLATREEGERGGAGISAPTGSEREPSAAEALDGQMVEREPVSAEIEETVVLESRSSRAEFSNRGAQLVSFTLDEHPDSEGGRVDIVRRRAGEAYPFGLIDSNGDSHALNDELFAVERLGGGRVAFEFSGASGRARKVFGLGDDGMLDIEIEADADGWKALLGPGIRNPSAAEQKNRFARKSVIYFQAGEVETLQAASVDEPTILDAESIRWLGVQDTYFLASFVPEARLDEVVVQPVLDVPSPGGSRFRRLLGGEDLSSEEEDLPRELSAAFSSRDGVIKGRAYFGAKQYDRLKSLGDPETGRLYGLEQAVEFGFFGLFARGLQVGLLWIHDNVVSNYGWAIILMTVVIRLILFPLTHKSFVSMQKMQELNPKIQAIRQKYRSRLKDKQGRPNAEAQRKMNEEVMGLYKKEGVNPAGGCLPMLLQLPVLFAFYRLLSAAVELRHAPWMGWIQDLSAPDPLYVLPLVMGASQFIQQKMTPTTADPMQRRIFMLMPVFFTVLFLGFPSGLVLYWLTNNVLGIVQQGVYRRLRHPAGGKK